MRTREREREYMCGEEEGNGKRNNVQKSMGEKPISCQRMPVTKKKWVGGGNKKVGKGKKYSQESWEKEAQYNRVLARSRKAIDFGARAGHKEYEGESTHQEK